MLLLAFLMLKTGLEVTMVSLLMLVGYIMAPAVGGFVLGKKRKVNRFLWGLCVGAIYFVVYAMIAICTKDVSFGEIIWVAIPVCLGGMAGGMLS
jgi:putative membrane protein (TIGR04086 family)